MKPLTLEQQCATFKCTPEQARAMHAQNAKAMRDMQKRAEQSGEKVNGYTAAQLSERAAMHERMAQS